MPIESTYAKPVLQAAIVAAARFESPTLHVVTVIEPPSLGVRSDVPPPVISAAEAWLLRTVTSTLAPLDENVHETWRVRLWVRTGDVAEEIALVAAETNADLIVMGEQPDRGEREFFRGRVPVRVRRLVACQVLTVPLRPVAEPAVAM